MAGTFVPLISYLIPSAQNSTTHGRHAVTTAEWILGLQSAGTEKGLPFRLVT